MSDTPHIDASVSPLNNPSLPSWATASGEDQYGVFVAFTIGGVAQRMRWIPPGRFLMGSPEDETGRFVDEGPLHEVMIREGFWLFDTPCTQALWEAVMGENPSHFRSPDRPVEQVSWEDVQEFIARINARVPGLVLSLPSEAQWEYACRSGTQAALYTGPIEIPGERNAPLLDSIAWYGGNSGVGFDVPEGIDSSNWSGVQYPNPRSGSHPVGFKAPNPWGLYDMLGNVWEWTQDIWHENHADAPSDGFARENASPGVDRVVRGGSWGGHARSCRCACRDGNIPGYRGSTIGFRCIRVQET